MASSSTFGPRSEFAVVWQPKQTSVFSVEEGAPSVGVPRGVAGQEQSGRHVERGGMGELGQTVLQADRTTRVAIQQREERRGMTARTECVFDHESLHGLPARLGAFG